MDYYNEIDPFACDWLELLINAKEIPAGHVDRRDIRDIKPSDLRGYRHCHFFAGIGGWARALQIAGWPARRKVWTGSCPCQPFSAAGRGGGFDDERHLWPAFFHLIQVERPELVVGEQVASKDGLAWLDLVHADLEGQGYTVGATDLCAAGAGAPHIRQRLWWVGINGKQSCGSNVGSSGTYGEFWNHPKPIQPKADELATGAARRSGTGTDSSGQDGTSAIIDRLANADTERHDGRRACSTGRHEPQDGGHAGLVLGDTGSEGLQVREPGDATRAGRRAEGGAAQQPGRSPTSSILVDADREGWEPWRVAAASPRYWPPAIPAGGLGPWGSLEWLDCRDGKARPAQSGFQSLDDGLWPSMVGSGQTYLSPLSTIQRNRVGMLRGAGNAIVPQVAAAFMTTVEELLEGTHEDLFSQLVA